MLNILYCFNKSFYSQQSRYRNIFLFLIVGNKMFNRLRHLSSARLLQLITTRLHLLLSEHCILNEQTKENKQISQAAVILTISVIVIGVIIGVLIGFLVCTLRKENYSSFSSLSLFTTVKYEPVRSEDDYVS